MTVTLVVPKLSEDMLETCMTMQQARFEHGWGVPSDNYVIVSATSFAWRTINVTLALGSPPAHAYSNCTQGAMLRGTNEKEKKNHSCEVDKWISRCPIEMDVSIGLAKAHNDLGCLNALQTPVRYSETHSSSQWIWGTSSEIRNTLSNHILQSHSLRAGRPEAFRGKKLLACTSVRQKIPILKSWAPVHDFHGTAQCSYAEAYTSPVKASS